MPIKPENKHLYPTNWKETIRPLVLERAENKCEFCGVKNHLWTVRQKDNHKNFAQSDRRNLLENLMEGHSAFHKPPFEWSGKVTKIVLTIAHIDQDPTNNKPGNLKALCQLCHNRLDAPYRALNRKNNKKEIKQL